MTCPKGEYRKNLPKFSGHTTVSVEDHLTQFGTVVENMEVEYEDVVMKMFVQTLEGDAWVWYKSLGAGSVTGWEVFKNQFISKWGDKLDSKFLLAELTGIEKKENETVTEFNGRFIKTLSRIPRGVQPGNGTALVFYINAFDESFGFLLRDKDPQDLEEAYADALKIEANQNAARKTRPHSSRLADPQEKVIVVQKIEDIEEEGEIPKLAELIQDLSKKIMRLERMQQAETTPDTSRNFLSKPQQTGRSFWEDKRFEAQKPPVPLISNNFVGPSPLPMCRACVLPHPEETCGIFASTSYLYMQDELEEDPVGLDSSVNEIYDNQDRMPQVHQLHVTQSDPPDQPVITAALTSDIDMVHGLSEIKTPMSLPNFSRLPDQVNQSGLAVTKSYHDTQTADSREIEICKVIDKPKVSLQAYSDRMVTMDVIISNCLVNQGGLDCQEDELFCPALAEPDFEVCTVTDESQKLKIEEIQLMDDACSEGLWAISFDGACSGSEASVGIVFNSISDKIFPYSYSLEFVCTNSVAASEVSISGLDKVRGFGIRLIKMLADSNDINQQVFENEKHFCNLLSWSREPLFHLVDDNPKDILTHFVARLRSNRAPRYLGPLRKLLDRAEVFKDRNGGRVQLPVSAQHLKC